MKPADPDLDALVSDLYRRLRSVRGVERELKRRGVKISKSSVSNRLAAARAGATPAEAPLRPALELPADTGDEDLDATRTRLRRLRARLDAAEGAAFSGGLPFGTWAAACRLEAELVKKVLEQIPPMPPDPSSDPTNAEEAAACLERFRAAVVAAEEAARCTHCGRNPWKD